MNTQPTGGAPASPSPQIVVASLTYPPTLPLITLPRRPFFPKTASPLVVTDEPSIELIGKVVDTEHRLLGLVLAQRPSGPDDGPSSGDAVQTVEEAPERQLHKVGVVAQVLKTQRVADGGPLNVLVGGLDRFTVDDIVTREPHLIAQVTYYREPEIELTEELRAYALAVINSIKDLVKLNPLFQQELKLLLQQGSIEEPGRLADYAAYLTSAKGADLQVVLEAFDVPKRLEQALELLRREIDISELQVDIRKRIEERISKHQREFFLREQLKEIKKELGLEKDDKDAEIQRFLARLEDREPSEEARARIDDEVDKLRLLEPASPEFNVTRNYLDWLTALPWGVTTQAEVSLASAREALNESHYGLADVKERIIEHVAAGLLKGSFAGSIILLVGPPGVGKTSIGRSIANSLGRAFYRFSLGGMRDEAEIKGHRRTYIGAMPGKFIQALRICKTADPVIMLDEIDKVGASYRGDPASALLEALDPEQNREFLDHYLDVRFDLSQALFICTANQLDTVPPPLLDRTEVIKLGGYLLEEKLEIATRFVVPRQLEAHGLTKSKLRITKPALRRLIDGYARDPGVRSVQKLVRKLVRKSAVRMLEDGEQRITIGPDDLEPLLGKRLFRDDSRYRKPRPGVVMGLAWTSMGGAILFVEATAISSAQPSFKRTGQLGGVMVESSEIAYTTARKLCASLPECPDFFDKHSVHLHVPAGATPKDGPSAGITMAAALYTLARGKPIKRGYAMTGELNLSGHVMPIGGIKEKVIAARRAKVRHIVVPKDNEGEFDRLPEYLKKKITPHFVETFDEVIALCLR